MRSLLKAATIRSRFDRYPGFRFQNLRDGLPMETPRSFLLTSSDWQEDSPVARRSSFACIIVDLMMASYGVDVAEEVGIPVTCYCNSLRSFRYEIFKRIVNAVTQAHRAGAIILHTFEELEGPAIAQIHSQCPNVYAIGPLPEHLKTRLTPLIPSKCVKKQDATEKEWKNQIPPKLLEESRRKGYIVAWAPQEEVVAHRAVGGYLTHCGWSLAMESIIAGVPMLGTYDRVIIEKMINELMDTMREKFSQSTNEMAKLTKKEKFSQSTNEMAKLAKKAVGKGGSLDTY
ncbi:7-deoxyloganetic acid glucosyltransferase-like [Rhododendron vialii]|uniref:7-deoxyloganetic acid glucosyltransferase-like n=1 Tax=Rhododendron vialii TaxID=182163 RepID=UPI00265EFAEB|nr:7-deoxyloganetic acid glucosyltransferase-like [Rhododendron vialii]